MKNGSPSFVSMTVCAELKTQEWLNDASDIPRFAHLGLWLVNKNATSAAGLIEKSLEKDDLSKANFWLGMDTVTKQDIIKGAEEANDKTKRLGVFVKISTPCLRKLPDDVWFFQARGTNALYFA